MHLIVAEKNLTAQRIAQILAREKRLTTKNESGIPVYSFNDTFVVGLKGHVVEVDFHPEYAEWRSSEYTPRSLIDAPIIKKITEKKIVSLIQRLGKKADVVTIATDYDTEGELIGKEALEIIQAINAKVPIHRAKFSAITPQEIISAFEHLSELDMALAAAGEARQLIDLVWGASLTRFISIAARRGGSNILSVGRVQSPTLAMLVDREKEIESFVPESYWVLHATTEKDSIVFSVDHSHGKFNSEQAAFAARDRTQPPLIVREINESEKLEKPPAPLDTTAFIVGAAKLGFSAARAMQLAEDLYMNGYISYPRTDNTVYPKSLNLNAILKILLSTEFAPDITWVQSHRRPVPIRGKKYSTDHPPIHPTAAGFKENLGDERWKIYELVVRRFLATLSPDARWDIVKVNLDAGPEAYGTTGSRLIDPGWKKVYPYADIKEYILPKLKVLDELPLLDIVVDKKQTQPPSRFTQSRLIQKMEELGLGTKSTRHEVISKLLSRRYVHGNPLRPTLVGRAVIEALEDYADTITKPEMTRTLEVHMQQIKEQERSYDDVVLESRQMLHLVFNQLEEHRAEIGEEIVERTDEERHVGHCPLCNGALILRYMKNANQFIGCSRYPKCRFNVNLPSMQWGKAVRTDTVCRDHAINNIKLIRKGAKPWDIGCPLCAHVSAHAETLKLMPSMTEAHLQRLHEKCIYTIHELRNIPTKDLSSILEIPISESENLHKEANEVLMLLRKRSELRKFVRSHIPPRRGRSQATLMNQLFTLGINDIWSLASTNFERLHRAGINEKEAKILLENAQILCNGRILHELGIPLASLKKYQAAGFIQPNDFCSLHPAYLSLKSGIGLDTVLRHVEKVCRYLGKEPPKKISKIALERGRKELLSIPGIGNATIEKFFQAGIINKETLKHSEPKQVSYLTGISEEKVREYILSVQAE